MGERLTALISASAPATGQHFAPNEVLLWSPSQMPADVWKSTLLTLKEDPLHPLVYHDKPSVGLIHNGKIWLGMHSGSVLEMGKHSEEHTRFSIPPEGHKLREDEKDREKIYRFDAFYSGARKINSLAVFNNTVYDAGPTGLFATEQDWRVTPWWVTDVAQYGQKLGVVVGRSPAKPNGDFSIDEKEPRPTHRGSLMDAFTGEVLVERITPFDGSGYRQGMFVIADDLLYTHHGNWPCERITVRNLQTGTAVKQIDIPTTHGLYAHGSRVYDRRMVRENGKDRIVLMNTVDNVPVPNIPDDLTVTSVWPTENELYVMLYDREGSDTRIIAASKPRSPFIAIPGYAEFLPSYRR